MLSLFFAFIALWSILVHVKVLQSEKSQSARQRELLSV